jgi:hypothetical protein
MSILAAIAFKLALVQACAAVCLVLGALLIRSVSR